MVVKTALRKKNYRKNKKTLNSWLGKKITLPNDTLLRNESLVFSNPKNKKIKIITLINGNCDACIYEIKEWEKFRKKTNTSQLGIIYIVYSNDNLQFFNSLLSYSKINFSYPYFKDIYKKVIRLNGFPLYDINFQTFLIDSSNQVIITGSPIGNETIEKLYLKEIYERLN